METIILGEIAKTYGVPAALGFYIWWTSRRPEQGEAKPDLGKEIGAIKERLVRIETLLDVMAKRE